MKSRSFLCLSLAEIGEIGELVGIMPKWVFLPSDVDGGDGTLNARANAIMGRNKGEKKKRKKVARSPTADAFVVCVLSKRPKFAHAAENTYIGGHPCLVPLLLASFPLCLQCKQGGSGCLFQKHEIHPSVPSIHGNMLANLGGLDRHIRLRVHATMGVWVKREGENVI